jgi:transposase
VLVATATLSTVNPETVGVVPAVLCSIELTTAIPFVGIETVPSASVGETNVHAAVLATGVPSVVTWVKRLRRSQVLAFFAGIPPCLVGLEACATAHHWARELISLGHEARLMPPNYVKAYVKRNKHDVADAEAICEAVRRPSMRFVPVKTAEQQSALMMHRARDLLIRQRTMLVNALRGHLAEFGLIEAQGLHKVARLIAIVMDETDGRVPDIARQVLKMIVNQIEDTQTRIAGLETQLLAWHKSNPVSQRLATIPGIGPIIATAIAATVADPNIFRSGREFAAWLGLVPRQNSTGGKARLGGISKRGDSYLRRLLVNSAHLCSVENHGLSWQSPWPTRRRAWLGPS